MNLLRKLMFWKKGPIITIRRVEIIGDNSGLDWTPNEVSELIFYKEHTQMDWTSIGRAFKRTGEASKRKYYLLKREKSK